MSISYLGRIAHARNEVYDTDNWRSQLCHELYVAPLTSLQLTSTSPIGAPQQPVQLETLRLPRGKHRASNGTMPAMTSLVYPSDHVQPLTSLPMVWASLNTILMLLPATVSTVRVVCIKKPKPMTRTLSRPWDTAMRRKEICKQFLSLKSSRSEQLKRQWAYEDHSH